VLRLLQHLTAAEGSVGFFGVLERHECADGESHENNQEYPCEPRVHFQSCAGNLLSFGSMADYWRRVANGNVKKELR